MKTMICNQLGGACEKKFTAATFPEIVELSKAHGKEMFHAKDVAHLQAMNEMKYLMQTPNAMQNWFEDKRKEFEALAED